LVDVQNYPDSRNIPLKKVGVKSLTYPITVLDRVNRTQHTTATVNLYANLPHHFKGTHMSRFIEVFNQHYRNLYMPNFLRMLEEIRESLEAETAYAEVSFPYFIEKSAPVSGQKSMMEYECQYIGEVGNGKKEFFVSIKVPVTTVCPCSKEISERGAHNQRGIVKVLLKLGPFFWIEDIVKLVEQSASSELYTLLKREDEKFITEKAYDNPRFVEDVVRETALRLDELAHFPWYSVEIENFESIHNHSAYACVERGVR
jgi:GTP cyclohydrolase I